MTDNTATADASTANNTARSFLPRLTADELNGLSPNLRGIILTICQLDPEIVGSQLRERVAELFPPELLFGDDVRTFRGLYIDLRDFLNRNGANIPTHSSHRIVRQLANGLYDEAEERETAEQLALDIQRGRSSTVNNKITLSTAAASQAHTSDRSQAEFPEKIAHNVAMRLKDEESKFSGDTTECWDEYVDNYRQIARDYRLSEEQKLQFLHNILSKDAKRFYNAAVVPHVFTFQQAIDKISAEYNSPVRQARVKNYLCSLRVNSLITKGIEESEALAKVYKTILKLSTQCPVSHRGDAQKIEFLRAAVVACEWAREPLSRVASHQLTYQQLYGELESALQLPKEAKLERLRDRATNPATLGDNFIAGINYMGQPRVRRGNPSSAGRKSGRRKSPLEIQGCFNCDAPDHIAKHCPRPLNLAKASARKLEYLNKRKAEHAVHTVLVDICQQFNEDEDVTSDSSIFLSLLGNDEPDDDGEGESVEEVTLLEMTLDVFSKDDETFQGACVDSGAQLTIVGVKQAEAYCREYGDKIASKTSSQRYRFGDRRHVGFGEVKIRIPFSQNYVIDVLADVVDVDVPFLLGLDILTKLRALLDIGNDTIQSPLIDWKIPLTRKNGHLYVVWTKSTLFTVSELRKVHRHFFHAQPDKIFQVLRRSNFDEVHTDDLSKLEDITRKCDVCQRLSSPPSRFRVTIPNADCVFNRCVYIDLMSIDSRTVLHAVDKDTKFSAARFLPAETTATTWDVFTQMWANTYAGYPEILAFDQGPQFASIEWQALLKEHCISQQQSGIESHNALGSGERYHSYLRKSYNRIRTDSPNTDPEHALSIAVKVCNDTAGVNGLSLTLLVFGIVPRLPIRPKELPVQVERLKALKAARDEMTRVITTDRIRTAIARNVPAAADAELVEGNEVLMYREKPIGKWLGLYVISKRDGKMLVLDTGERFIDASIDKVKPYYAADRNMEQNRTDSIVKTSDKDSSRGHSDEEITRLLDQVLPAAGADTNAIPADEFVVKIIKAQEERAKEQDFIDAMRAEVKGLKKRDVWTVVKEQDMTQDAIVMGGRFVLCLKNAGTPDEKAKARFVAQGYDDKDKPILVNDTPVLRSSSIRLILSAAAQHGFRIFSHDVTQAYLQSKQRLSREIYIRLNPTDQKIFGIEKDELIFLKRPLYGLCDAGDYWAITLDDHVVNDLGMRPTVGDPALYTKSRNSKIIGMSGSYVDDSLNAGTLEFEKLTESTLQRFESKPRIYDSFDFYGA